MLECGVMLWNQHSSTPILHHSSSFGFLYRRLRHDFGDRAAGSAKFDRNHAGIADDLAAEFFN